MKKDFILLVWLVLILPASAEIYQWKDEHGRIQFSDSPPKEKLGQNKPDVTQVELKPITEIQSVKPAKGLQGDSGWREREASAKARKKARRLEKEKLARKAEARKRRCKRARANYRSFQSRPYGSTDLNAIRTKRAKRDRLKQRMKDNC